MTTDSRILTPSRSLTLPLPADTEAWLKSLIFDVPGFPKPDIVFKDITPLLADGDAFKFVIDALAQKASDLKADVIVGFESRGFIFGTPLAHALGIGFVPIRKPKKLPREVEREEYELEYGKDTIEMHRDAFKGKRRAFAIDDLLATGGTAAAGQRLIDRVGGVELVSLAFVIELGFLEGRKKLMSGPEIFSILTY